MRISPAKRLFFNEMNKEILGEILSILPAVSVAPNKRIDGTGIASVEPFESGPPLFVVSGCRDQAPLGGLECEMTPSA
jgi:hypothetical protein